MGAVSLWGTIQVARQYMLGIFAWGFAQGDSVTRMLLRTIKYLRLLYHFCRVRDGSKAYERLSLKVFKGERARELARVSR